VRGTTPKAPALNTNIRLGWKWFDLTKGSPNIGLLVGAALRQAPTFYTNNRLVWKCLAVIKNTSLH
jgi:hypothetical protein